MPVRVAFAAALLAVLAAVALPPPAAAQPGKTVETASGLKYTDTKLGDGAVAANGLFVEVHYTGWLYKNGSKGAQFDSSRDRGKPIAFKLGAHQVIPGWEEGIGGMKVGGTRTLIIPPEQAYGAKGAGGGLIPPNSTLLFEVELVSVR
jgi:FKBP-type peptidyl-prolyl cis-trans isomerase